MKLVRWKRFIWDLTKLPSAEAAVPTRFNVRPAIREDERAVAEVIFHAFSTDNCWSDLLPQLGPKLHTQIAAAFSHAPVPILVIAHGQRVIGASLLNLEIDAENHLLSGPCILAEYRSRGLGTILLQASLQMLRSQGLTRACGISKEMAPACKFVYRKFDATVADYDYAASLQKA